jgi:enoyl-CoA hydratase/carnithine racemase
VRAESPSESCGASVRLELGSAVAGIVLDRQERRNALSLSVMRDLIDALDTIAADPVARVVVLEGHGRAFSAGHDLAEMVETRREDFYRELFTTCVTLMQRLHAIPQPVIAKVGGVATAAGCQLVAACDLAVASTEARFATPGVNIGLFCSTPMVPVSRSIGRKRALEMLLTGDMIDAATALDWGLVNRVVAPDELDAATGALAERIVGASGAVIALGRRAFYAQEASDEDHAYALTCGVMIENAQLDDAHEGMRAFLEKRKPNWVDR